MERARARGLAVTPEDDQDASTPAHGGLDIETWRRLEDELAGEALARPGRSAALPVEVATAAERPERQLGDFVLVERVGRGGASEVWKAWDRSLARFVAVKIPHFVAESVAARERFAREALAAARLTHPNILPVHQVAEANDRVFLVMPYVAGTTLEHVTFEARRAAAILRDIALAIQYAHDHGVIHRDIKPSNVILGDDGAPRVLDFGLGYLAGDRSHLTPPEQALGTLGYMAPEQARGGLAARSTAADVYGLGATLFHMLTGRAPYVAENAAALLAAVLQDDPPPLRSLRPDLPAALEAVVRRAMERAPQRRYPSARALAADLDRFLAGAPVLTPIPSWTLRAAATLRQRRVPLFAALGALVLAVAALIAWSIVDSARRTAIESIREEARTSLDAALRLRRSGDTAGMRQLLPRLEAAYRRARQHAPRLAELDYLMGRMHRALMEPVLSLRFQAAALQKDPEYLPARYERAIMLSARYGFALRGEQLGGSRGHRVGGAQAPDEAVETRAVILDDLRRLHQARAFGAVDRLTVEGILAFHEERFAEARRALSAVVGLDEHREEAWEHLAAAAAAEQLWDEADAYYRSAIERDRGYAPYYLARCRSRVETGRYGEAAADATTALTYAPDLPYGWLCRAVAGLFTAQVQAGRGQDVGASLDVITSDLREAETKLPKVAEATILRGMVHLQRARLLAGRGEDAAAEIDNAERLGRVYLDDTGRREARWQIARACLLAATLQLYAGTDPTARLQRGRAALATESTRDAGDATTLHLRGTLAALEARWRLARGDDAASLLATAEADLGASLSLRETGAALLDRGAARIWAGLLRARQGGDPAPTFQLAQQDLDRALGRDPDLVDALVTRARLGRARAEHARRRGSVRSAALYLATAGVDVDRALALAPRNALALIERAHIVDLQGHRRAAARDRARALAINPRLLRLIEIDGPHRPP